MNFTLMQKETWFPLLKTGEISAVYRNAAAAPGPQGEGRTPGYQYRGSVLFQPKQDLQADREPGKTLRLFPLVSWALFLGHRVAVALALS